MALVIGHRGAPGWLPEHTLAGYRLAIRLGADYVEPDLVATADGRLVARHEPQLGATTDVAERPEFAARRRAGSVDGLEVAADWFASDFTLAELKTLRARQSWPGRARRFDGCFEIPTLEEVIALAQEEARRRGRPIGVYPETKHAEYHRALGLALEPPLARALERAGWGERDAPVFVQSFEAASLRRFAQLGPARLVQLLDDATDDDPAEIATYAAGIGPRREDAPELVERAHAAGLLVHAWTFGDSVAECRRHFALGVDGVFTDFADTAWVARELFRRERTNVR